MVVAKKCTRKPSKSDAWRVDLTPLLLVGLLGEATNTVEVKRLETLALALLVGRAFLLDRLEANTALADTNNHAAARCALAIGIELLGESETDFRDASSARFLRVVEKVLLFLENIDRLGGLAERSAKGRSHGRAGVTLLIIKRETSDRLA